ncbi:MAG TPA: gamma-glutamyl-gamma-aminobutyrate hydrolase family protein [Polyangia bacterium]|nr:gamma-glutamyl-gamma-aminobutyrate hydrolase family protein [Polyangia bacterium]
MRRLLLYKTGETDPRLVEHIGDYERWFSRVLGDCALEIHRAFEAPRHRLAGYDGLVISGSPRSLVEPEPWMDDAAAFVRAADDAGVPVLGVCFGHQLIGYAYGGEVRKNPNGWEVGTVEVELTDEGARDALFAGLPRRLRVNQSHRDEVGALGPRLRRLAHGAHTGNQALAAGEHVRGVQFHPEMDGAVIRHLMAHRRAILDEDATCRGRAFCLDTLLSRAADTPDAERVLRNFVAGFVKAA